MKWILLPALFLFSSLASAQGGLYAPAPPANSAFVRVLGQSAASLSAQSVTAAKGAASSYVIIPQGEFKASLGAVSKTLKVEAGKFYSAFARDGKITLLLDQAADNRAKALLSVYNLSKYPSVDLKTADGKTSVIAGVKSGTSGSRAVNGITVDLAAFAGPKAIGTVKAVKLARGNAYALVVTDSGMTVTQSTTKAP